MIELLFLPLLLIVLAFPVLALVAFLRGNRLRSDIDTLACSSCRSCTSGRTRPPGLHLQARTSPLCDRFGRLLAA